MRTNIRQKRRRQRRQRKLRKLKAMLAETNDPTERQRIIEKIRRVTVNPKHDLPEEFQ